MTIRNLINKLNFKFLFIPACTTFTFGLLSVAFPAYAVTLFDQIGDGTATLDGTGVADQNFESALDNFDVAIIDDFVVNDSSTLLQADAVFFDNNIANATQWNVAIFSSPTAAGNSLIGDVAHAFVDSSDVSITTGFNSDGEVLVEIPIDLSLTNADTYWLGIYPDLDFNPFGQSFVSLSSLANDTADNAIFANPGNGFGNSNTTNCVNIFGSPCNVAYRLEGVIETDTTPVNEPASILGLLFVGSLGANSFKRKKSS